ncbi:MAG: phasin family protein [Betaproteobacteria bacterium]
MYNVPEQLAALNKTNVDAFVEFFGITTTSTERLVDFQMKTAKAAFAETVKNVRTLSTVKDPQEWVQVTTALAQPSAETFAGYARQLQSLAAESQGEFARYVDEHINELNKQIVSMLDQAAKTGPAGSDVAVAAAKSAVAAANQAYDVFVKAGRQVAELTDASVQAVASAGVQAANSATPTSKKKAA